MASTTPGSRVRPEELGALDAPSRTEPPRASGGPGPGAPSPAVPPVTIGSFRSQALDPGELPLRPRTSGRPTSRLQPGPGPPLAMNSKTIPEQLLAECDAMTRHALRSGLQPSGELVAVVESAHNADSVDVTALGRAHAQLSRLIAPAKPDTVLLMSKGAHSWSGRLGAVPLVKWQMSAAAVFLVLFLSMNSWFVDPETVSVLGAGWSTKLVYLSAAGLGAAFAGLFEVNRYIVQGTYDPKYDTAYQIRFALGILAGVILAELVPVSGDTVQFTRPTLAMLGGFSAKVVYRILKRLVDSVESIVGGDPRDQVANEVAAAKLELDGEASSQRLQLATQVLELRRAVANAEGPDVEERLDAFLRTLVDTDRTDGETLKPLPPATSAPAAETKEATASV